ncbi:hypothetical protein FRB90_004451, partial [Tulasnella sp. 427]
MEGSSPQPESNGFEVRRQNPWQPPNPLETAPVNVAYRPDGDIPNTPLMMSFIA